MIKVGIAGIGAIGSAVYRALQDGIMGYHLHAVSDIKPAFPHNAPNLSFDALIRECDLVIECLPPKVAADFVRRALLHNRDIIVISSCVLLTDPTLLDIHKTSTSRIIVPSGALSGLDGVNALKNIGIKKSKIVSTKPPRGFTNAPYVLQNDIKLDQIKNKTLIFEGNALEAARRFPANVNVAATLSLAGIGPQMTQVEIWADPDTTRNSHEITVESEFSTLHCRVENAPDPANPKSSILAAQSIIATLRGFTEPLVVL